MSRRRKDYKRSKIRKRLDVSYWPIYKKGRRNPQRKKTMLTKMKAMSPNSYKTRSQRKPTPLTPEKRRSKGSSMSLWIK